MYAHEACPTKFSERYDMIVWNRRCWADSFKQVSGSHRSNRKIPELTLISVQVILNLVELLRTKTQREKVVCVSNFTSTLDGIGSMLETHGYTYLRLDGSVPTDKRQAIVDKLNCPSDPTDVFLLYSKAGGVGLNL